MGRGILPAKLQIPPIPPKTLFRPRLADRLAEGLHAPLTVLAADAGFGKTTAVAAYLTRERRPSVW